MLYHLKKKKVSKTSLSYLIARTYLVSHVSCLTYSYVYFEKTRGPKKEIIGCT